MYTYTYYIFYLLYEYTLYIDGTERPLRQDPIQGHRDLSTAYAHLTLYPPDRRASWAGQLVLPS